ncbi:MAG: glycine oxidase ThiO [Ktedonobacteraceae bacterium]
MQRTTDVVVIGGGVIGCAIAYYLSKQGVDVTLLEQGEIGSQASGAAAGIFSLLKPLARIDDYNRLLLASRALFPSLMLELKAVSSIDPEYEQTSTLRTARSPNSKMTTRLQRWAESCQQMGLQVQLLTEEETRQLEPLLSHEICAATFIANEGQVRSSQLVNAYAQAARNCGAILQTQSEVVGVEHTARVVKGVTLATGAYIACNTAILASGAWAAHCGDWFDVVLPIVPQRGQSLSLQQPSPPLRHTILGYGVYLAPKRDNTLIVGATQEEVGFDTHVTAGGLSSLLDAAIKLVPALAECPVEQIWAGLRPKTPDNCPILGKIPGWENVILAIGHNSFGMLLSAITGQTIAELVIQGQTPEIIHPFTLERFVDSLKGSSSSADKKINQTEKK